MTNQFLFTARVLILGILLAGSVSFAQEPNTAVVASDATHVVSPGDTIYGLVAIHYPKRMNNWTEVATDLVTLNPDQFPDGLDTSLSPGMVLRLPSYTASKPVATPAVTTSSEQPISTRPTATSTEQIIPTTTLPGLDTREVISVDVADERVSTTPVIQTAKIGEITAVTGDVRAISSSDQQRRLRVNDEIYLGDALLSGNNSSASLRMVDNAIFHLRDNSRILFEHYEYESRTKKGRSVLTLLKGGFRAISGLLGKADPSAITINTAVATIGIRGTDYGLRVCETNSCNNMDGSTQLASGLYSGVLDGVIALSNNTGETEVKKGEFFYIKNPNVEPAPSSEAAAMLFSAEELENLDEPLPEDKPLGFWRWLGRWITGG